MVYGKEKRVLVVKKNMIYGKETSIDHSANIGHGDVDLQGPVPAGQSFHSPLGNPYAHGIVLYHQSHELQKKEPYCFRHEKNQVAKSPNKYSWPRDILPMERESEREREREAYAYEYMNTIWIEY